MASLSCLPPELLLEVLSYLDIRPLLSFSETCRAAHFFTSSSLHTLNLGIYPNGLAQHFGHAKAHEDNSNFEPVSLVIPDIKRSSEKADLAFHNKLTASIIQRYSSSIQHLTLRLWTLSPSIATALTEAKGLRSLHLRIDNPCGKPARPQRRLREMVGPAAREEEIAWNSLAHSWSVLHELNIEGGKVDSQQVQQILEANPQLTQLSVKDCSHTDADILKFACEEWAGKESLTYLGFEDSPAVMMEDLEELDMGAVSSLQTLSLRDCIAVENERVQDMNKESWHIPELLLSAAFPSMIPAVIEVDPAFM